MPPLRWMGAALTADQMRAAMADARNFIAQSDVYQDCLMKELDAAKTQAGAAGQPLDPGDREPVRAPKRMPTRR